MNAPPANPPMPRLSALAQCSNSKHAAMQREVLKLLAKQNGAALLGRALDIRVSALEKHSEAVVSPAPSHAFGPREPRPAVGPSSQVTVHFFQYAPMPLSATIGETDLEMPPLIDHEGKLFWADGTDTFSGGRPRQASHFADSARDACEEGLLDHLAKLVLGDGKAAPKEQSHVAAPSLASCYSVEQVQDEGWLVCGDMPSGDADTTGGDDSCGGLFSPLHFPAYKGGRSISSDVFEPGATLDAKALAIHKVLLGKVLSEIKALRDLTIATCPESPSTSLTHMRAYEESHGRVDADPLVWTAGADICETDAGAEADPLRKVQQLNILLLEAKLALANARLRAAKRAVTDNVELAEDWW
ncbi:uncharacterized protein JCM10292_001600 [Rhodotorula paludigena]|uniref:uncharacterized protein n=1 Tax=Rhodotorula paludigena TaxID=86838 RepID=UPI003174885F